ncbi:unnamed protein product [Amoebophrya sp. A120]|nr:unnamed protein product [Amoebophrya sp. A120]|eukprot:GSA120T00024787001.1
MSRKQAGKEVSKDEKLVTLLDRVAGNLLEERPEAGEAAYDLLKRYNLKRCNRVWNLCCMMSMTDSHSVPLFAIQISPDCSGVRGSGTCHAQSYESWLDHALLHHRFPYSIVTFETVTPERVIPRGRTFWRPCTNNTHCTRGKWSGSGSCVTAKSSRKRSCRREKPSPPSGQDSEQVDQEQFLLRNKMRLQKKLRHQIGHEYQM